MQVNQNLQRGAFTWSIDATIRTLEQLANCARYCCESGSLKEGPSMLCMITQTKQLLSCGSCTFRNERRSSIDRELKVCSVFDLLLVELFLSCFNWSERTSARVIRAFKNEHIINKECK